MGLSAAYPNPVLTGETVVRVNLMASCPIATHWSIVTVDYRMVLKGTVQVVGRTVVAWDLKDGNGKAVANGLYYFLLKDARGAQKRVSILLAR